ncbi:tyrosine-type recombinase/integrase [Paenibacillus sp. D9]|uniref:tyrosine-type recombinase/integrase n=1 Tax=Paenibacillus sp. D9 TaxID=665792 RepID=UPI00067669C0|nr:tyrosine-type recombinase/integrase [Paenibacillus sp. D9]
MASEKSGAKPKDYIYENTEAKSNPFWFQVMVNGKRVTRRGFRTRGEAKKARAALITELSKDEYIEPSKMTFGEYYIKWLKSRNNLAFNTLKMYSKYFKSHINPVIGHIPISKLTPSHIEELLEAMREKGLGDEMVKRNYAVVHAALNAAVKKDILIRNVAGRVEKPKVTRKERPLMETDALQQMLKDSKDFSRYWIAAYLAVMTGMRIGEICGLQWADIDFDRGLILVQRNMLEDTNEFSSLKTNKSRRVIAISPQVVETLKEQRQKVDIEKAELKGEYQDRDLVVCSSKGTAALQNRIRSSWKRIQELYKKEDEPELRFHDLRHAHASILLKQGVHPKVVSERLGHSTITLTLETYSHLLPHMQSDAAIGLEQMINLK